MGETAAVYGFNRCSKNIVNNIPRKSTSKTMYLFKHFIQELLFEHLKCIKYFIMLFIENLDEEDTLLTSENSACVERDKKNKHSNIV